MPRYLIERSFPHGIDFATDERTEICIGIVRNNAEEGVHWVHSYVAADGRATFCVYDGPSPEAVRRAARRNQLPVNRITEICMLDPYSHI